MDSECSRSIRLSRERLRISRALAQEEQKIAALRDDLKFRTVTDELTCLLSAQTKLDMNRNQVCPFPAPPTPTTRLRQLCCKFVALDLHLRDCVCGAHLQSIKHFHKRLMLEMEDYIRKLKVGNSESSLWQHWTLFVLHEWK